MVDFEKIIFPCQAEYLPKGKNLWEKCLVLGREAAGSAMHPSSSLMYYYLIVDREGVHHKIFDVSHVRYNNSRDSS